MHIDTNAQNCNFLSEFVSLRGSLSCQWIVRCAALSLSLPLPLTLSHTYMHSLSLFCSMLMWLRDCPENEFPPDGSKMVKTIFKMEGKECELSWGSVHGKHIFCLHLNSAELCIEAVICVLQPETFFAHAWRFCGMQMRSDSFAPENKFHLIPVSTYVPTTSTFPSKLCRAHKHVVFPLSILRFRAKLNMPVDTEMP